MYACQRLPRCFWVSNLGIKIGYQICINFGYQICRIKCRYYTVLVNLCIFLNVKLSKADCPIFLDPVLFCSCFFSLPLYSGVERYLGSNPIRGIEFLSREYGTVGVSDLCGLEHSEQNGQLLQLR